MVDQLTASPRGESPRSDRRITRPRGLPGGRAVVGALLIASAAIAVFAAYLDATSEPSTRFLVAAEHIAAGTVIDDRDVALALFSSAPLSLVDEVADHAVAVDDLDTVIGLTVLAPLEAGQLLQRGALLESGRSPGGHVMSFALPAADAVGGSLTPGETIDVLATYRTGRATATAYVVRAVPVLAVGSGGGTGSTILLTVSLPGSDEVQALGHAVNTASVFVVSTVASGDDLEMEHPEPYRDAEWSGDDAVGEGGGDRSRGEDADG